MTPYVYGIFLTIGMTIEHVHIICTYARLNNWISISEISFEEHGLPCFRCNNLASNSYLTNLQQQQQWTNDSTLSHVDGENVAVRPS